MRIFLGFVVFLFYTSLNGQICNDLQSRDRVDCITSASPASFSESSYSGQLREAIRIAKQESYFKGEAHAYYKLGILNRNLGAIDSSLFFFRRAISVNTATGSPIFTGRYLRAIGSIHRRSGQLDSALFYYQEYLDMVEKDTSDYDRSLANLSLGILYSEMDVGQNRAKSRFYKALKYGRKAKSGVCIRSAGMSLSTSLNSTGQFDSSIIINRMVLRDAKAASDTKDIQGAYSNLSHSFSGLGMLDSAKSYARMSNKLSLIRNDSTDVVINYNNLGTYCLNLSQVDSAIVYFKLAEKYMPVFSSALGDYLLYQNLSVCYKELGDYENALKYLELYEAEEDSIFNREREELTQELEFQYENEKLRRQRTESQAALERKDLQNRNLSLGTVTMGLVLILSVVLIFIYRSRIKAKELLAEQKEELHQRRLEQMAREEELKRVNALLEGQEGERRRVAQDLHDRLGSMLSTVKYQFSALEEKISVDNKEGRQGFDKAYHLLDEACQEVRKIAHNMVSGVLSKFGLIAALEELAESVSSDQIRLMLHISGMEERLDNRTEIILYRVVQELVSNILKHAQASQIDVHLTRHEQTLNIIVEDNGKGFSLQSDSVSKGMGLKNIQGRLGELEGSLDIDSQPGHGTTIIMDIPLEPKEQAYGSD